MTYFVTLVITERIRDLMKICAVKGLIFFLQFFFYFIPEGLKCITASGRRTAGTSSAAASTFTILVYFPEGEYYSE